MKKATVARRAHQTWTSQDGRTGRVRDLDLSHLLNIVHDCNFRVSAMRELAMHALGQRNLNVDERTVGAFGAVQVADVFPAWRTIVRVTKEKFREKFGVSLADTRNHVYDAWEHKAVVPGAFREAVEFCLLHDAQRDKMPVRMMKYLGIFRPGSDSEFRTMCWNLRIDQPIAWKMITSHPMGDHFVRKMDRIPMTRLNTAFNFEPQPGPIERAVGRVFDDWQAFR